MQIAIVKYNAGNVRSVQYALERLGVQGIWTDDPAVLRAADKVIFPGVGEASTAMEYLRARGLAEVLCDLKQPVLGICLGLQLFCRHSEEGNTTCLGIFDAAVRRFPSVLPGQEGDSRLKVPHMGWNRLKKMQGSLFSGVREGSFVYFVHSFYAGLNPDTAAQAEYGMPFSAALQRDNFFAVQFHPERSGPVGQQILENFLNL